MTILSKSAFKPKLLSTPRAPKVLRKFITKPPSTRFTTIRSRKVELILPHNATYNGHHLFFDEENEIAIESRMKKPAALFCLLSTLFGLLYMAWWGRYTSLDLAIPVIHVLLVAAALSRKTYVMQMAFVLAVIHCLVLIKLIFSLLMDSLVLYYTPVSVHDCVKTDEGIEMVPQENTTTLFIGNFDLNTQLGVLSPYLFPASRCFYHLAVAVACLALLFDSLKTNLDEKILQRRIQRAIGQSPEYFV